MNKPFVSVRVITYNHAAYIRKAIDSVLMQKVNFTWEIVIADDCSTDGTREILQTYLQKYPNIIRLILQEKNVGAAKNWSDLMSDLSSTYTAYFEGDDYWTHENKLQMQVDILEKDASATICFTEVAFWNENSKKLEENWLLKYIDKERFACEDILTRNVITTCSVLFRNVFKELPAGILDFPFTDWPLYLFLLTKGTAVYIPKVTAIYRLHNSGIFSGLEQEHKNYLTLKIYELLLTYPQFNNYNNQIKRLISERAYIAFCYEIKKARPDQKKVKSFFRASIKNLNIGNLYFPTKSFFRNLVYTIAGKSLVNN